MKNFFLALQAKRKALERLSTRYSLTVTAGEINHQPLLFYQGNEPKVCQVFGIEPETNQIFEISNVLNPRN